MNKETLKKLDTLYKCRNHWSWLWITGSTIKTSYLPSKKLPFGCVCCENAGAVFLGPSIWEVISDNRNCEKCALLGYAWTLFEYEDGDINAPCERAQESFFRLWEYFKNIEEQRRYYAYRMVYACNRAIEDILTGERQ